MTARLPAELLILKLYLQGVLSAISKHRDGYRIGGGQLIHRLGGLVQGIQLNSIHIGHDIALFQLGLIEYSSILTREDSEPDDATTGTINRLTLQVIRHALRIAHNMLPTSRQAAPSSTRRPL